MLCIYNDYSTIILLQIWVLMTLGKKGWDGLKCVVNNKNANFFLTQFPCR